MTEADIQLVLEDSPVDDQMERLEDLLTELKLLTRRYKIVMVSTDDGLAFFDLVTQRVIGLDLVVYTKDQSGAIDRYDARDSILDGVWLIRGPDGALVEQHTQRSPWPSRER